MDVPFFANTEDGLHCFQAACKMILKYYQPSKEYSWQELEKLSDKRPGMSTWPQRMLINLKQLGFETSLVESFDAVAFTRDGASYLKSAFGEVAAAWQIQYSDLAAEQVTYRQALELGIDIQQREPSISEMRQRLNDGYLLICTLNSRTLNHLAGYVGHSVVLFDIDDAQIMLHDPGLPPQANKAVSTSDFEAAWADPNRLAKNYIAIKPL